MMVFQRSATDRSAARRRCALSFEKAFSIGFSRGTRSMEPRSLVDLSALAEGICEDAAEVGEKVTFSGPRDVTIFCRPTATRRAISNLVDNAVKVWRHGRRLCQLNMLRLIA